MKDIIVVLCFTALAYVHGTPFDSSKDGPPPVALQIDGCTALPCVFSRGTNVTGYADFTAASATTTLTPVIKISILGISDTIPYDGPAGCDSLTVGTCPLAQGDSGRYSVQIPVLNSYPRVQVTLEISVVGDDKKSQFSFKLPIRIK